MLPHSGVIFYAEKVYMCTNSPKNEIARPYYAPQQIKQSIHVQLYRVTDMKNIRYY